MRRVINKQDYLDNWKDLRDCVVFIAVDCAIAVGLFALMLIAVLPVTLACVCGIAPDLEEGDE